jgi:hypothetical protein
LVLVVVAGCGGGGKEKPVLDMSPPAETSAQLVGARCHDGVCKCRGDGDAKEDPPPAEGLKRFEFKLSSGPGTVWVTINNSQKLVKDNEQADACFYVDLGPGQHQVAIYGKASKEAGGVGAQLAVHEYYANPKAPGWYDTFFFKCGFPAACDPDELRSWKDKMDAAPEHEQDPCGSTKVIHAQWHTGRLPDGAHPDEFVASAELKVYDFAPKAGPGQCPKAHKH